jgi:hypothetical protein
MDRKLKELERLVAADPSNYDAVSRLHYFQKRIGAKDSFAQKIESAKDIYEAIHIYFGTEEGQHYSPIKNETETNWFIYQNKISGYPGIWNLSRIYNPINFDNFNEYLDIYYNDHGGAAPIEMDYHFYNVVHSIYGSRNNEIRDKSEGIKERDGYTLIYSNLSRSNNPEPDYRLFKNSKKIDIAEYWKKYRSEK